MSTTLDETAIMEEKTTAKKDPRVSAHLQLHKLYKPSTIPDTCALPPAAKQNVDNNQVGKNDNAGSSKPRTQQTLKVHTYMNPHTNTTWMALNTPKAKFHAFLEYSNVTTCRRRDISTREVVLDDPHLSQQFRASCRVLWKNRTLLADRTELMAVYSSDKSFQSNQSGVAEKNGPVKRGGFADLLNLYTERLLATLRDEQHPQFTSAMQEGVEMESQSTTALLEWLAENYGRATSEKLMATNFTLLAEEEQLKELKLFLEWFRSEFPYYYDRCEHCGASMKDDLGRREQPPEGASSDDTTLDATATNNNSSNNNNTNNSDEDEEQTFVGFVYPSDPELRGRAGRTELYQCHKCRGFTRFPRFNAASHVLTHRRGRCGEYSMLLYRFLRALQHEARWVVDWADHVWAEIALTDRDTGERRWVHLDPCEASVDDNLLYENWGKKQTYILSFYAPPHLSQTGDAPTIEDVTSTYTSDSWEEISQRRDESEEDIARLIGQATDNLKTRLTENHAFTTNETMTS